jgi:hypothetical protein
MIAQINIGGKMRGIRFGNAALIQFEEATGHSFLTGFEAKLGLKEVAQLAYFGLKDAARFSKEPFDYELHDVIEWLDEPGKVPEIMAIFSRAVPEIMGVEVEAADKKKATKAGK